MRKKTRWDKKKGIMKRNFRLSDRNWILRRLAVGNLNNDVSKGFVRRTIYVPSWKRIFLS